MTHNVCIAPGKHAPAVRPLTLLMIAGGLVAIALVTQIDTTPSSVREAEGATAMSEDWHGNVRRSHWSKQ